MLSSRTNVGAILCWLGVIALAEDAERRIAVASADISQNLVVGPVLLDDVDDVLEDARLADALGHGPGGWSGRGGKQALGDAFPMVILPDDGGKPRQFGWPRERARGRESRDIDGY